MLLITAALAQPPGLDVYAWSSADEDEGHLVVALTSRSLPSGTTWVVELHTGDQTRELACTRTADAGMVCRFDDTVIRTTWGATHRSEGFVLFAGDRADPSPAETRRAVRRRRDRAEPDAVEPEVVSPVEALVVGLPLDRLGPRGPVTIEARAVRRSWRPEVRR